MKKNIFLLIAALFISVSGISQLTYTLITNGLTDQYESGQTEFKMGDIDADGDIDIVSVGDHYSPLIPAEHGIMIFKNNGNGTSWTKVMEGDFGYGGVALGDVNNDGHMDVAYGVHHNYSSTDLGDQVLEVVLGNGTGTGWTPYDNNLGQQGQTWGMFGCDLADLDNDGLLDLGSNSFGCCDGVWLYTNNGDGSWSYYAGALNLNSASNFLFGDLDNDGMMDFVANNTHFNNQQGQVWKNIGNGQFIVINNGWPLPPTQGYYFEFDLGDVDNDGAKDIAITYSGRPWVFKLNPSSGGLVNISNGLPTYNIDACYPCISDMDGDGRKDLVVFCNQWIRIYRGDANGNWICTDSLSVPSTSCYDMNVADLDHNGFPDIAYWGKVSGVNMLRVYLNTNVASTLNILPVYPLGGENLCANSVQFIEWISSVPPGDTALVSIALSTSGNGGPFTNIITNAPNSGKYQWSVPAVSSSNCHLRFVLTSANGSDTAITAAPFNINPCSGIIIPGHISGPVTLCPGDSASYSVPAASGATSYTWTLPWGWTGSSTTNNITVMASDTGGVISVVANGASGSSIPETLIVNVIIVDTSVTVNGNTLTASPNASSYQWMDCDSMKIIPGEINQSFTPVVDGSYAVIVNDSGCVDTSSCYQIIITGLRDSSSDNFIDIIPNPSSGKFNIKSPFPMNRIEIYNVIGKNIFKLSLNKKEITIDISKQPNGIYFFKVFSDNDQYSGAIIKKE